MHPNSLYYLKKRNWTPLPQWGQSFLDLGYALAIQTDPGNRIIAGLALPTRAYAAALAAAGIIAGKLSLLNPSNDALKRFQQLATLTIGTSLFYRKYGKRIKVLFDGLVEDQGQSMIRLRAGSEKYLIPPALALQVEFPAKEFTFLPTRSPGRTAETVSPFLSHFLDMETAKAVVLQSHLDCIIIGSIGRLDDEVNCTPLAVQDADGEFLCGTLQDIIRVRRFSTNEAYRSDIYHTHRRDHTDIQKEMPTVIIFDGARSFLKWRDYWKHPHYIVLLDQTELEFDAAVQVFNEECIKNHLNDVILKKQLKLPKGVPISVYQEELR